MLKSVGSFSSNLTCVKLIGGSSGVRELGTSLLCPDIWLSVPSIAPGELWKESRHATKSCIHVHKVLYLAPGLVQIAWINK